MNSEALPLFSWLGTLLRDPEGSARRCHEETDLRSLVLASLAAIGSGGVLFGAALGSSHGLRQTVYSGMKLPLALLAALLLCVPAFHAIAAGVGKSQPFRSVVALTLAATARAALVLMACAPLLWLGMDLLFDYHQSVVAAIACYLLAGTSALGLLLRGLQPGVRGWITAGAFVLVLLPVGGQTAWMLRPFLGRPSQSTVPLYRASEGSFADSAWESLKSSAGYHEPQVVEVISESRASRANPSAEGSP